jgi:hypothetical protein
MATLARNYHEQLQTGTTRVTDEERAQIKSALAATPEMQTHGGTGKITIELNQSIAKAAVGKALKMAKNCLAAGMDRCS